MERVVGSCEDPLRNRIRETSEGNLPSIKSRRVILKFITFAFSIHLRFRFLPTIASLVGFEQTPANRTTNSIATHLTIN